MDIVTGKNRDWRKIKDSNSGSSYGNAIFNAVNTFSTIIERKACKSPYPIDRVLIDEGKEKLAFATEKLTGAQFELVIRLLSNYWEYKDYFKSWYKDWEESIDG